MPLVEARCPFGPEQPMNMGEHGRESTEARSKALGASAPHLTRAGDGDPSGQPCWPRARPSPAWREQRPALPSASRGRWLMTHHRFHGGAASVCQPVAKRRSGTKLVQEAAHATGPWKRVARWQARPGGERLVRARCVSVSMCMDDPSFCIWSRLYFTHKRLSYKGVRSRWNSSYVTTLVAVLRKNHQEHFFLPTVVVLPLVATSISAPSCCLQYPTGSVPTVFKCCTHQHAEYLFKTSSRATSSASFRILCKRLSAASSRMIVAVMLSLSEVSDREFMPAGEKAERSAGVSI